MLDARTCLIVTGPYRSGTSLTAQILCALGVDFGCPNEFQLEADRYNPGGYFQRRDIVQTNTRLILRSGISISEPAPPDLIRSVADLELFAEIDLAWTHNLPLFGIKDPR